MDLEPLKQQAAEASLEYVQDGHVVGLGTGSTVRFVVIGLAARVKAGLRIAGVPTSAQTAALADEVGVPLLTGEESWQIDVAIDGADQVDPQMNLIKGGGGALLKEKIVAAAASRLVIVADYTKRVPALGDTMFLPIEVARFGWRGTARQVEAFGRQAVLRRRGREAFTTEAGNYIIDLHLDRIADPQALESALSLIPGVVETGLFVGRTDVLVLGTPGGAEVQLK